MPAPIFELIGPYCFLYTLSKPARPRSLFPSAVASIPSRVNVVSKSAVFSVAARRANEASITRGTPIKMADLNNASLRRRTTSCEGEGVDGSCERVSGLDGDCGGDTSKDDDVGLMVVVVA